MFYGALMLLAMSIVYYDGSYRLLLTFHVFYDSISVVYDFRSNTMVDPTIDDTWPVVLSLILTKAIRPLV